MYVEKSAFRLNINKHKLRVNAVPTTFVHTKTETPTAQYCDHFKPIDMYLNNNQALIKTQ